MNKGDKMYLIILMVFIVFTLFLFISNSIEMKNYKVSNINENMRVNLYKNALIFGMVSLIIVGLLIIFTTIRPQDILTTQLTIHNIYLWMIIYGAMIIMFIQSFYRILTYMFSKKARIKSTNEVIKQMKSTTHHESFLATIMLPKSLREKIWFTLVSISAGISEEIVWRGLLIFLIQQSFSDIPIYFVLIVASLLFGIGHNYQGLTGILKTALVVLLLTGIFVLSGNLIIPIILHFVLDFANCFLYDDNLIE